MALSKTYGLPENYSANLKLVVNPAEPGKMRG